jgi:hypothetical protein
VVKLPPGVLPAVGDRLDGEGRKGSSERDQTLVVDVDGELDRLGARFDLMAFRDELEQPRDRGLGARRGDADRSTD